MRLRRSDLQKPGLRRRRSGTGFRYLDTEGKPLKDKAAVERIKGLVIPPAWQDVWISPDPRGHVQAVGTDAAGRRLSTLRPEHVRTRGKCVILQFPGKSGVEQAAPVDDAEVGAVLRELKRRRRGEERLFAYWDPSGRSWHPVHADEINDYLRENSGEQVTAKDFRTWHGTLKAAQELAESGPQPTETKRNKAVAHAMKEVADLLGNTPAVARSSYVDPRVIEHFAEGDVVAEGDEEEVLDLLSD